MRKMKKISIIAIIGILLTIIFQTFSYASTPMNSANLVKIKESENHLQYNKNGSWSYVIATYVGYSMNGKIYPAYCLDSTKLGVNEAGSYTVNIDKVIDREDVWRVIINGFPYKSPSELGVRNDLDAFVSTKMAVYCLIYNWNPDTYFRQNGPDTRGNLIANCISNLVNIGRNGSQTRQNVSLNISKVGDFQKSGNNYYQEYSVSSAVRMENYSITSLLNAPSGSYCADTNGNKKTTFASGEKFRVYIPESELAQNIDITILVASKCETYPVLYGKAPNGRFQDYALTYDPLEDIGGQANLKISTNNAEIEVIKTDNETGERIAGVLFGLYKDGTEISRATTDANGQASFDRLMPGKYIIKEISNLDNYVINTQDFEVNVKFGEKSTINITNEKKKGQIKVVKIDKDNNEVKIEGVTFKIYDELGREVDTLITDTNGEAISKLLPVGQTYTLKEISTLDNYVINTQDFKVDVKFGEISTVNVTNEKKKGQIKVVKIDKDNNEVKIEGVTFKIYDELGREVDTLITDTNGEAISKLLPVGQTYTLKEISTLDNYVINTQDFKVDVKFGEISTVNVTNEKKKGQIEVIKIDKDYNEIKLEGVTFEILDKNENIVDTLVTDTNGKAISKLLPIDNEYTIREKETRKEYILTEKIEKVILKENEIRKVTFENEIKKGNLKIYKIDKDNKKIALGGVEFELFSNEFNKVIGKYLTDANGEILIENLRIGEYKLHELKTNKWYNLSDNDNQQIIINWNETTNTTVENEKQKGQIKVIKIDKDNNEVKLKGVKFNVLDEDGNILETIITNENGEAFTKEYPVRDFEKLILQEVETLKEYKLNTQKKTIELKANEITNVTFENEVKKGKIKIIKVDKDNNEVKLQGVTFEVLDENGKIVQTLVTDKNGECETDWLPISKKYTVRETITKEEYVLSDKVEQIELKEDEITNLTFENEIKKGQIKVFKTDGETKKPLKDIEFEIYDSKGELVDTLKTDENGEATSKRLSIFEEYTIVETKTKKGYVLNAEEVNEIELKEDEITNIKFENYKGKGTLRIVKKSSNGVLNGFRFLVKGTTYTGEKYEQEFVTNDEGIILIEDLLEGKYTITEIRDELSGLYEEVPSQEIEIKNGETTTADFYNKLIEVPNTGDNSKTGKDIAIILIVLVFAIIILTFFYVLFGKSKNKNTNDKK